MKREIVTIIAVCALVVPGLAWAQRVGGERDRTPPIEEIPFDVLERYYECMERHDLEAIKDLLWYHHNVERIDASVYGLPVDDFDDGSLLTIDERLTFRQEKSRVLSRRPDEPRQATTGPLQYPHHLRHSLDHHYEVTGERRDCSEILGEVEDPTATRELGSGWASDLDLTAFDNNDRGEVDIVIDYANPNRIMASSVSSGGTPEGTSDLILYSGDWGQTWGATGVGNNSGTSWECDPVSYYQRSSGNVYHSKIGCSNSSCAQTYTLMRYSANNGAAWADCARPDTGTSEDRQWHVVDNTPTSACYNTIYLTWHNSNQEKVVATNNATGDCQSWGPVVDLTGTYQAITPDINVAADGHAYVVWQNYGDATFKIAGSDDCGASWNSPSPTTVKTRLGDWKNNIPAQCVRGISTLPNVDVDRCPWSVYYGRVYMTMFDFDQAGCGSGPGCTDWSNSCDYDVWFTYSDDQGVTWAPVVNVSRDILGHGDRVDSFMGYMRVDESDGSIYIGYHRTRLNPAALEDREKTHYFMARSIDGGGTWEEIQLSTEEGDEKVTGASTFERGDYNHIDVFQGAAYPVFVDRRGTTGEENVITRKVCSEPAHRSERAPTFTAPSLTMTSPGAGTVDIGWSAPDAHWGDGGENTAARKYQLWVDGALAQDNILWSSTSLSGFDPGECNAHDYVLRAINQCGIAKDYQISNFAATGCCADNPTGVSVTPSGPLTLCTGTAQTLTATPTGGTAPFSYRWYRDGGAITGETSPTFNANESGTHGFTCEIIGASCTSGVLDGSPTNITWQAAPTFGGITSASNGAVDNPCTIDLEWNQASTVCAGPVTYRVYRSTTSGVLGSLIASGLTCGASPCTYSDVDTLVNGTPYYYVVRAYDASTATEDSNVVEAAAIPTGTTTQVFFDDFEGAATGWVPAKGTPAASTGDFVIGDPVGTVGNLSEPAQPEDGHTVVGVNCLYTAENPAAGAGTDDVDAGEVMVTSPTFDGSGYDSLHLSLWRWFLNEYANDDASDYYYLEVSNNGGSSWVELDSVLDDRALLDNLWTNVQFDLENYVTLTSTMSIRARASDGTTAGGLIELAIDDVEITGYTACTTGASCTDPGAVTIDSIADDDTCAQDGVTITFSGGTGASSFDLRVDGSQAVAGITSPYAYNPGDSDPHGFVVRAADASCFTDSASVDFTDANNSVSAPAAPMVTDDDACAQSGVTISWTSVAGATSYDLWIDGTTIVPGVSSPYSHNPTDEISHNYQVRASNACGDGAWSPATSGTDVNGIATPAAPTVTDVSACATSGVSVSWNDVGAATYDLWVDGAEAATGIVGTSTTFSPGDNVPHNYQVVGHGGSCSSTLSAATSGTDEDFSFTFGGIASATDRDGCDDTGVIVTWNAPAAWNDGGVGSRTFVVLRDGGDISGVLPEGTSSFVDSTGINGTSYNYAVRAVNGGGCSVGDASVMAASDVVGTGPSFGGVQSVTTMPGDVCGLRLGWSEATSGCVNGPAVSYNVYRSTTGGFTPDPATNLIASCVADLHYDDMSALGGTTYYYVVRAEDSSVDYGGPCNNGWEDANTTELSGLLSAGGTTQTLYSENFDSYADGNAANWTPGFFTGDSVDWRGVMTCTAHSGTKVYRCGGTRCNWDYLDNKHSFSGPPRLTIDPSWINVTLDFWHRWYLETGYDGVYLRIALDGSGTYSYIDSSLISSGNYNDASGPWWSGQQTTFVNTVVDLDGACDLVTGGTGGCAGHDIDVGFVLSSDASTNYDGWFIDDVVITADVPGTACEAAPDPVQHFTGTSTAGQVLLEWQNPATYPGGGTTKVCRDGAAFPDDPSICTVNGVVVQQVGAAGAYDAFTDSAALTNGTPYYYSIFVDNGTGVYSARQTVLARPIADVTGKNHWSYHSSATSLAPPGLYPGAIGTGAAFSVSNDRVLHGMQPTTTGGEWPRTAPYDWMPMAMNGPSLERPPVVATSIVPGASLVVFLGSTDGHAYAVNAHTGTVLWQSPLLSPMVTGAPAVVLSAWGGSADLLFVATREAGGNNQVYALNPATGAILWTFDNSVGVDGDGTGIGIISASATVDYANSRLYFASRENAGGSTDTLWCINFSGAGTSLAWATAIGDVDGAAILQDGRIYVGNNSGTVYAFDATTQSEVWQYATADGPVKAFVMPGFTAIPRDLFFSTTNTVWKITDGGASASLGWEQTGIGAPSTPLALTDQGKIYVGSNDGNLYEFLTATGAGLKSLQIGDGGATVGSPGYDWQHSLAYVGSEDGAVYAVELPLQ